MFRVAEGAGSVQEVSRAPGVRGMQGRLTRSAGRVEVSRVSAELGVVRCGLVIVGGFSGSSVESAWGHLREERVDDTDGVAGLGA